MKTFLEYAVNGRVITTTEALVAPPASFGGTVIEVAEAIDPGRTFILNGTPQDIGPRPTVHHIIDYVAQAWRLPGDLTELGIAQDAKWVEIRDERDRRETQGFPYLGKILDSDSRSVQRITTAVQSAQAAIAAGVLFEIGWTCADNSVITLDALQMIGVPVALAQYGDDLHCIARDLRAQIEACETVEDVAAIAWPA